MPAWRPYGTDHWTVLAVLFLAAAGLVAFAPRLRGRPDQGLRRGAAAALLLNEWIGWGVALASGHVRLPVQLCDLAVFAAAWALWSLKPFAAELAFYWGLAACLQAALTPDLAVGFPDYWWIKFFLTHCGTPLAALYLGATGRVPATQASVWRVLAATNGYALIVGFLNLLTGANYGYLAAKPQQPSVLDFLGPWPIYLVAMEGLAVVSFWVCYTVLRLCRRSPHPTRMPSSLS